MRSALLAVNLFAVLAGTIVLPACAAPAPRERVVLAPCDIQLHDAPRVARQTPISATIVFPFKVTNGNNEVPVLLERLTFDASINQSPLGQNICTPRAALRPRETRVVNVNYDVSFIGAGVGIIQALTAGSAAITVAGDALISVADQRRYEAEPLGYPFQIK